MQATHTHEHHHHPEPSLAETVQPWLKTLVLFGLAVYFGWNIISGNLTNYINTRFVWLSYVAAALFLLLAISSAWGLRRARSHAHHDHEHDHHHDHDHDHSHERMSWVMLGVVALPLLLGTLVPSRPLGADAIDGSLALTTAAATTTTTTALSINPLERNVLDWLRIFNSVGDYEEVAGQPADVIGFVYREPTFGDNRFMVARFTISCCVADASAIGVPVAWDGTGELQADTWVRVQGAFAVDDFRDDRVPVLQAASVEPVPQPEHPYLYP